MVILIRIAHHRRFTENHTWYLDIAGRSLFVKANPNAVEARQEMVGHARIRDRYPVPAVAASRRIGWWTVHIYTRWPTEGRGALLLDEIVRADRTGDQVRLDACIGEIVGHYRSTIIDTLKSAPQSRTVAKLYRARATPGGRLDRYYSSDQPLLRLADGTALRPTELATVTLVVNGRPHRVDFARVIRRLREDLDRARIVWAALTQGDPTDHNIGWSPQTGPVWFDYDTGGLNTIAGEFACFLLYQRLHGAWLTPTYNAAVFRDHPGALSPPTLTTPSVELTRLGPRTLEIRFEHQPSTARRLVMRRYLDEVIRPVADHLRIDNLMAWLRPYIVMRLLAVYDLGALDTHDAALSLALLAEALHPDADLGTFLGLRPSRSVLR